MPYLSLYRKYRPQCFADVVGQEPVVQTIQNALKMGRVANGYLFCGTRGVAKTTIARIFAKCLNCIGENGDRSSPASEPCGKCSSCLSIAAGQCVDVVEMDAASNRSVADIAKLRENVHFGPMENRFKVYIVDEAHQLSSDAKDAFLKTLEEPPANVVFILATTEAHSIPVTIASRCQRFDFRRGSVATIAAHLNKIAQLEGVRVDSDALELVARSAEGSYRDSLSLLDQVLAYKREDVTLRDVSDVFGTVEQEMVDQAVDLIAKSDAAGAFAFAERVFTQGKDVRQLLKTLSERFRDMLFSSVGAKVTDENPGVGKRSVIGEQAKRFTAKSLLDAINVLAEAERETKGNNQHRLLLEMALLRLIKLDQTASAAKPQTSTSPPVGEPSARDSGLVMSSVETSAQPGANGRSQGEAIATGQQPDLELVTTRVQAQELSKPSLPVEDEPIPGDLPEPVAELRRRWGEVINHIQAKSQSGVPLVRDARPVDLIGKTVILELSQRVWLDKLDNKSRGHAWLEEIVNKVLRVPAGTYKIKAVLKSSHTSESPPRAPVAPAQPAPQQAPAGSHIPNAAEEQGMDFVDEVISVFGGTIVEDSRDNQVR